eukprot:TRINITY_DN7297_c0_g2_i1.p1 TRINITY_DN7297_c0_g2~~TRINITY_DN7297_c0_g2_i1.p1  ORF type:complete len:975 (+),score=147.44 TRINITY_DN7297_c0_g2_i1:304-2925(+)
MSPIAAPASPLPTAAPTSPPFAVGRPATEPGEATPSSPPPVSGSTALPPAEDHLRVGAFVELTALTADRGMNGLQGFITQTEDHGRRRVVSVPGHGRKAVRLRNLRPAEVPGHETWTGVVAAECGQELTEREDTESQVVGCVPHGTEVEVRRQVGGRILVCSSVLDAEGWMCIADGAGRASLQGREDGAADDTADFFRGVLETDANYQSPSEQASNQSDEEGGGGCEGTPTSSAFRSASGHTPSVQSDRREMPESEGGEEAEEADTGDGALADAAPHFARILSLLRGLQLSKLSVLSALARRHPVSGAQLLRTECFSAHTARSRSTPLIKDARRMLAAPEQFGAGLLLGGMPRSALPAHVLPAACRLTELNAAAADAALSQYASDCDELRLQDAVETALCTALVEAHSSSPERRVLWRSWLKLVGATPAGAVETDRLLVVMAGRAAIDSFLAGDSAYAAPRSPSPSPGAPAGPLPCEETPGVMVPLLVAVSDEWLEAARAEAERQQGRAKCFKEPSVGRISLQPPLRAREQDQLGTASSKPLRRRRSPSWRARSPPRKRKRAAAPPPRSPGGVPRRGGAGETSSSWEAPSSGHDEYDEHEADRLQAQLDDALRRGDSRARAEAVTGIVEALARARRKRSQLNAARSDPAQQAALMPAAVGASPSSSVRSLTSAASESCEESSARWNSRSRDGGRSGGGRKSRAGDRGAGERRSEPRRSERRGGDEVQRRHHRSARPRSRSRSRGRGQGGRRDLPGSGKGRRGWRDVGTRSDAGGGQERSARVDVKARSVRGGKKDCVGGGGGGKSNAGDRVDGNRGWVGKGGLKGKKGGKLLTRSRIMDSSSESPGRRSKRRRRSSSGSGHAGRRPTRRTGLR